MNLSTNITSIRKRWKENMEVFGQRFDMSRTNIGRYESGEYEASISFCMKLSELTGISVERLVNTVLQEEEIPPLPLGEGGEKFVLPRIDTSKGKTEIGNLKEIENIISVVRSLQTEVEQIKSMLSASSDFLSSNQDVANTLRVFIAYLKDQRRNNSFGTDTNNYLQNIIDLLKREK